MHCSPKHRGAQSVPNTMTHRKPSLQRHLRNVLAPAFGVLLLTSTAWASFSSLKLDTVHSKVGFTAATVIFDVDGAFDAYEVQIEGDPAKPDSVKVRASIDVASINTQNTKRDTHLKSPDFFDAAKHPKITFASTSVKAKGKQLDVKGNLEPARGGRPSGAKGRTARHDDDVQGKLSVDRNDFGIGTDSIAAKISLEDEVEIKLLIVTFQ